MIYVTDYVSQVFLSLLLLASPSILETDKMVIVKGHTVKFTDCCKVLRERNIISRKEKMFFSLQVPEYILNFILYYMQKLPFLNFKDSTSHQGRIACLVYESWFQLSALSNCLLIILHLIEHLEIRN